MSLTESGGTGVDSVIPSRFSSVFAVRREAFAFFSATDNLAMLRFDRYWAKERSKSSIALGRSARAIKLAAMLYVGRNADSNTNSLLDASLAV